MIAFRAVNVLIAQDNEKLINDDYVSSRDASDQSKMVILSGAVISLLIALCRVSSWLVRLFVPAHMCTNNLMDTLMAAVT